jgi:predicted amidohydrolase YtcJ
MAAHATAADTLIRSRRVYSFTREGALLRALALSADRILSVSSDVDGLGRLVTARTRVIDEPDLAPVLTIVGGRAVYDAADRWRSVSRPA